MIKKLIIIFVILFFAPAAFAITRDELNVQFFDRFNDDSLSYYIDEALKNNHSVRQASARVEQYRQQAKYTLGAELPSLSVSANYLGLSIPKLDNDNFALKNNAFVLPFLLNYEADFLLKNRDKTRSAKKSYEAEKYEEKAVYISLLCDVATVYTNILQYDELIMREKMLLKIRQDLLKSEEKKFARGVINSSAINDFRKSVEISKSDVEILEKQQEILIMQLAVLSGKSPLEIIHRGKFKDFEYKNKLPEEIKSEVIYSRPDVLAAEKNLEKAGIDVRIARKEFLPSFNITGIWAFNTIAPGNFFSWESSLAALLAGATQDIFKGGRKVANLRLQKAKYEEICEKYKQTDLEALKDVNTALCLIKHDRAVEDNAQAKLYLEQRNFENSKKKFDYGVISASEYLTDQADLQTEYQNLTKSKAQRIVNYFTLYKAVGGNL